MENTRPKGLCRANCGSGRYPGTTNNAEVIFYSVIGWLTYLAWRQSDAQVTRPAVWFLGLMVEWFLLGNAPVLEPFQVIIQPGMFTFWGTLLLGPLLMVEPDFPALKWSFARFFVPFSLIYLVVAVIVPKDKGGIFFDFVIFAAGTTALNWFYVKYFRGLAKG